MTALELQYEIENLEWHLAQMTIHQINFTEQGQRLQDRLEALREKQRR